MMDLRPLQYFKLAPPSLFEYTFVHEQVSNLSLTSTCQVNAERRVLDLGSEVMRGPGSIPTEGNILSLDYFFVFT